MGSAIGDYIHYNGYNYDKHGTNRRIDNYDAPKTSYKSYMNNRLKQNETKLSQEDLDELAETISTFMENSSSEENQAAADAIREKLIEDGFDKNIVKQLDLATGKVNISTEGKIGKLKAKRGEDGNLYLSLTKLVKTIDGLENAFLQNKQNISIKTLNALKGNIAKAVNSSWGEIKKKTPKELQQLSDANPIQGKTMREIRANINRLINDYAKFPNIFSLEGMGFEYAIIAGANNEGDMSINEALNKLNVGTGVKTGVKQYNPKYFFSSITEGNSTLTLTYNQRSKIDVLLQWKEQDLRISAKNISFNKDYAWVHLVDGSPLLFMLQDMEGGYLNHYINTLAVHGYSTKANQNRNTITENIKGYLFFKALTGNQKGQKISNNANLLIINDKSGKNKVKVYDMGTICAKAMEDLTKVSVQIDGLNIAKLSLINENNWDEQSAENRINKLLTEMHQMKVSVAFNAAAVLK